MVMHKICFFYPLYLSLAQSGSTVTFLGFHSFLTRAAAAAAEEEEERDEILRRVSLVKFLITKISVKNGQKVASIRRRMAVQSLS
jgi:hypothetical protein